MTVEQINIVNQLDHPNKVLLTLSPGFQFWFLLHYKQREFHAIIVFYIIEQNDALKHGKV